MNNNINALIERVVLALVEPEQPKLPDEQEWLALAKRILKESRP